MRVWKRLDGAFDFIGEFGHREVRAIPNQAMSDPRTGAPGYDFFVGSGQRVGRAWKDMTGAWHLDNDTTGHLRDYFGTIMRDIDK
ncbi:MAG: hypothetical protein HY747_06510 [Elusimicrobia bacterium]|nr:hypothetical protein [Elusimicrobiota bacterium]